jgi:hypothetical protein
MADLAVTATLRRDGAPLDPDAVSVSFAMRGMEMGENRVRLAPRGAGRFEGKAVLVRCPSGRRDWGATVSVARPGGGADDVAFPLSAAE